MKKCKMYFYDSVVINTYCGVQIHISLAVTPNHHLQGAVGTDRVLFRGMSWQGRAPLVGIAAAEVEL